MINKISQILRELKLKRKAKILVKMMTLLDDSPRFHLSSSIDLRNGSTSKNILIGKGVWMYGVLRSSSGGIIKMGDFTKIGPGSSLVCVDKITIGDYTAIANNVQIVDNNNHPINPYDRLFMRTTAEDSIYRDWKYSEHKPIVIGKNVWVGANARINKGVNIGDNSIIAANTVVTKDVPENSIVAGNPGKVVKTDIDKVPRVF